MPLCREVEIGGRRFIPVHRGLDNFQGGQLGCLCLDTMEEFYV